MDIKELKDEFEKLKYIEEKLEYLNFDEHLGCYVEKNNGMPVGLAAWVNGAFYGFEQAATAQAVPEWISVNDKMPDEGDEVFVHHYGHIVQATKDQKYSGGFKQRNCYGWEAVSSYISHWMPMSVVLPESYHFYYGKPAKQAQEQSHE